MRVLIASLPPLLLSLVCACESTPERPLPKPDMTVEPTVVGVATIDRMLNELDGFRRSASFQRDGFRTGSRHEGWLERIGAARDEAAGTELRDTLTKLEVLGLSYAQSGGLETLRTRTLRTEILLARRVL